MSGFPRTSFVLAFLALLSACSTQGDPRGEAQILVAGLPSGLEGDVRVKDGDGKEVERVRTSTLLRLSPGLYTLEANPVQDNAYRYLPRVEGSPLEVKVGVRSEAKVTYTRGDPLLPELSLPAEVQGLPGEEVVLPLTVRTRGFQGELVLTSFVGPFASLFPTRFQVNGDATFPLTGRVRENTPLGPTPVTLSFLAGERRLDVSTTLLVKGFTLSLSTDTVTLRNEVALTATVKPVGLEGEVNFALEPNLQGLQLLGGGQVSGETSFLLRLRDNGVAPGTYDLSLVAELGGYRVRAPLRVVVPPKTGTLVFVLVPPGADPGFQGDVRLRGPISVTLQQSATLELPVGTYTFNAYAVGGYLPTPSAGTVEVRPGAETGLTVSYSSP